MSFVTSGFSAAFIYASGGDSWELQIETDSTTNVCSRLCCSKLTTRYFAQGGATVATCFISGSFEVNLEDIDTDCPRQRRSTGNALKKSNRKKPSRFSGRSGPREKILA